MSLRQRRRQRSSSGGPGPQAGVELSSDTTPGAAVWRSRFSGTSVHRVLRGSTVGGSGRQRLSAPQRSGKLRPGGGVACRGRRGPALLLAPPARGAAVAAAAAAATLPAGAAAVGAEPRASERASEAEPAAEEPSAGPALPAPRTKAAMKPGPPRRGAAHGPRVDTTTHAPRARGLLLPPLLLLLLAGRAAGVSDGPQEGAPHVTPRVSACLLAARSTLGVSWSRGVLSPP